MDKPVLIAAFVCLMAVNFAGWGVDGIEGETSLNDLPDTAKKALDKLPVDLTNGLGPIDGSAPAMDEAQRILKEKCLKNSHLNDSYELAMEAKDTFSDCVSSLIALNVIQGEIKEATPKGEIDMVFKKYCKKSPELKNCVVNYTSTLDICLDADEKNSKNILQNVTEALLSFVCHDEGDRIALFYSEGGPNCLDNKKEAVNHCFNTSFSKYTKGGGNNNMTDLPSFKFEEDQCASMHQLQLCVVNELIKCGQPTPGNIVESLFEFVRRSTPCSKFNNSSGGSALKMKHSLLSMISTITLGILTIFLGRMSYE